MRRGGVGWSCGAPCRRAGIHLSIFLPFVTTRDVSPVHHPTNLASWLESSRTLTTKDALLDFCSVIPSALDGMLNKGFASFSPALSRLDIRQLLRTTASRTNGDVDKNTRGAADSLYLFRTKCQSNAQNVLQVFSHGMNE